MWLRTCSQMTVPAFLDQLSWTRTPLSTLDVWFKRSLYTVHGGVWDKLHFLTLLLSPKCLTLVVFFMACPNQLNPKRWNFWWLMSQSHLPPSMISAMTLLPSACLNHAYFYKNWIHCMKMFYFFKCTLCIAEWPEVYSLHTLLFPNLPKLESTLFIKL